MNRIKIFFGLSLMLATISLLAQTIPFHYFDRKTLTDIQGQVLDIGFEEVYGKNQNSLCSPSKGTTSAFSGSKSARSGSSQAISLWV
ncbi:MAG: hypothetical protein WCL37_04615 [Chrysiogenales bacterium]